MRALIVAVALAAAAPPVLAQGTDLQPPEAVLQLLNQGKIEEGEKKLRELLAANPAHLAARLLLGRVLDHDGRPDEAIAVWRAGLAGRAEDFPLLMSIGSVHMTRANEGPTVSSRRGMQTFQPNTDPAGAEKYKQAEAARAAEVFRAAIKLAPEDERPQAALAVALGMTNDQAAAAAAWQRLAERNPKNPGYAAEHGKALALAGRAAEAEKVLEAALKLDARNWRALEQLGKLHESAGRAGEAARSRDLAQFYRSLPPFSRLAHSPETQQTLKQLNDRALVKKLIDDPSRDAAEYLAVIAWRHPHNDIEDMAFASLDKRGAAAADLVRGLFSAAQSTCTIRSSARILARHKEPGLLERLLRMLPGDLRGFGFDMDIAGALDELGDARAVPALVQVLNPRDRSKDDGPEAAMMSRSQARVRAALALGAFDVPETRAALAQGLDHPELAPYASAALYRITKGDARYLPALKKMAGGEDKFALYVLSAYLAKVDSPEAAGLVKEMRQRLQVPPGR